MDGSVTISLHKEVLANYTSLYANDHLTDVKIIVDDDSVFKAHKLILAAQSPFFEAMFYSSPMIESKTNEVHLKETDADILAILLQMVYSGCLDKADQFDPEILIQLYILIERYQFIHLEICFLSEIQNKLLNFHNFWQFFDLAVLYNVTSFIDLCFNCLERLGKPYILNPCFIYGSLPQTKYSNQDLENTPDLYLLNSFTNISYETINILLDKNITVSELQLFRATLRWIEANANSINKAERRLLLKKIRLSLIAEKDLLKFVDVNYVIHTDLVKAINLINLYFTNIVNSYLETCHEVTVNDIKYKKLFKKASSLIIFQRAILFPNYNICQFHFGFTMKNLQNEDYLSNDIDIEKPVKIIVNLGFPYMLNYIDMVMSDVKGDKFSYLIEYSVDGNHWTILYDYRKYLCSNHQMLFFNPIVCKCFRIQGYHQIRMDIRTRKVFDTIKSFKAFYSEANMMVDVKLVDGILLTSYYTFQIQHRVYCYNTIDIPSINIRYYSHRLCNVDDDECSMFTSSSKSSKSIFVLMDQPIMLSSFMFQLFDKDGRSYSYVADIFDQDEINWCRVADRSNDQCSSWQTIMFSLRPVNLIRIRGLKIYNSTCKEFRIVKFNFTKTLRKKQLDHQSSASSLSPINITTTDDIL